MRVIATRRDPSKGAGAADKIVGGDGLLDVLPQADFVALTRPLTPKTEKPFFLSAGTFPGGLRAFRCAPSSYNTGKS